MISLSDVKGAWAELLEKKALKRLLIACFVQQNGLIAEPHSHHGKEKETHEGFSHGYHG